MPEIHASETCRPTCSLHRAVFQSLQSSDCWLWWLVLIGNINNTHSKWQHKRLHRTNRPSIPNQTWWHDAVVPLVCCIIICPGLDWRSPQKSPAAGGFPVTSPLHDDPVSHKRGVKNNMYRTAVETYMISHTYKARPAHLSAVPSHQASLSTQHTAVKCCKQQPWLHALARREQNSAPLPSTYSVCPNPAHLGYLCVVEPSQLRVRVIPPQFSAAAHRRIQLADRALARTLRCQAGTRDRQDVDAVMTRMPRADHGGCLMHVFVKIRQFAVQHLLGSHL